MKDFFANMTFPRAVIVVSLLASAILGYLLWSSTNRLAEVNQQVKGIKADVYAIQDLALQLDALHRLAGDGPNVAKHDNYVRYVTETAQSDHVNIGSLQTTPSTTNPMAGLQDRHLKVKPAARDAKFFRANIGNFLYKLEQGSNRVKVTSIKMNPHQKLRPGEIVDDKWEFDAEITVRQSDG